MAKKNLNIWLVNPWIHDFTAYDLWSKPLGLLYLAQMIRDAGHHPVLVDMLDRNHPVMIQAGLVSKKRKYGVGSFFKQEIEKPEVLKHIPRKYSQYGIPDSLLPSVFSRYPQPDIIFITSLMTYWYPAVRKMSRVLREKFPTIPQVLGGIYPTLIPDHAREIIKPDALVKGSGANEINAALNKILPNHNCEIHVPESFSDFPMPALDLYEHPSYLVTMSSRGCPYRCSFCASYNVAGAFQQKSVEHVVDEIIFQSRKLKIRDVAFYDDALLVNKEKHIKPILKKLLDQRHTLRFHTPNGIHGKMMDEELAKLMVRNNFKTIRISYEFFSTEKKKDISFKISNDEFVRSISILNKAGFRKKDIESYVIMGLPGQSMKEVLESMLFVHSQGVKIRLASFSPIPGTLDFARAVDSGAITADIDPLLCNKSIFPLNQGYMTYQGYHKLRQLNLVLNDAVNRDINLVRDTHWNSEFVRALETVNNYAGEGI